MTTPPQPTAQESSRQAMLPKVIGLSRLIVELGVFSSAAFSLVLFAAAITQTYHTAVYGLQHLNDEGNAKHLMIAAVEQADILLVGLALLIVALGMHVLFIGRIQNLPSWLHVHSFDDLKSKLLGVVITALGVNFFSVALEWKGGGDILPYGVALAAVIAALALYNLILDKKSGDYHEASAADEEDTQKAAQAAQENEVQRTLTAPPQHSVMQRSP